MPNRPRRVKRKKYESAIRAEGAEQTRAAILNAARRLFLERGYEAMTMQAVAADADVALDTVYATVGRKPLLARLLVETAISDRDHAVPAEERDYVVRIKAAPSAREKLLIYATAVARIAPRLGPLVRSLKAAAPAHPELASLWREIAERRANNMRLLAEDLLGTGELRRGLAAERIADILWATNAPEFYTLLVDERGWSCEAFGAWLADAWTRLLL
jgi:AcrR family transcriptional regulator